MMVLGGSLLVVVKEENGTSSHELDYHAQSPVRDARAHEEDNIWVSQLSHKLAFLGEVFRQFISAVGAEIDVE